MYAIILFFQTEVIEDVKTSMADDPQLSKGSLYLQAYMHTKPKLLSPQKQRNQE